MSNIIDVIISETSSQTFIVIDKPLNFLYEEKEEGNKRFLIGECEGFFNFYSYRIDCYSKAFAGRKFDIPLKNGNVVSASGQWWDACPDSYRGLLYFVGAASLCQLKDCYVFTGVAIDKKILDDWMKTHTPSHDYNKYKK